MTDEFNKVATTAAPITIDKWERKLLPLDGVVNSRFSLYNGGQNLTGHVSHLLDPEGPALLNPTVLASH